MEIKRVREVAESAARFVGERIKEAVFTPASVVVKQKGVRDLVTEIDLWAEEEIKRFVRDTFPDHLVFGEESGQAMENATGKTWCELINENICWIVDPLDGTTNFVNRIPHVAVSIGVLAGGERVFGLVFDICRDELFTAVRGHGAFLNGRIIKAAGKKELIDAVCATGLPSDMGEPWLRHQNVFDAFVRNCHKVRIYGSAALDLCWTACGRLDAFFEYGLKPWDVAGGSVIVEEAGGNIAAFAAPETGHFSLFGRSFLAAAPALFPQMLHLAHDADQRVKN